MNNYITSLIDDNIDSRLENQYWTTHEILECISKYHEDLIEITKPELHKEVNEYISGLREWVKE